MPKISVIIAVYNGERFVRSAIESIQNQTFVDWELVICDDGSTDDTVRTIENVIKDDKRISFLKNLKNRGPAYSRNRCVDRSQGEYIAVQDADDVSVNSRLEEEVNFLDRNPDVSVVSSYAELLGDDGNSWGINKPPVEPLLSDWVKGSSIVHAAAMVRKKDVVSVGGYDERYLRVEDYNLWLRMIAKGFKLVTLPKVLYRVHWDVSDYSRRSKDRMIEVRLKYRAFRCLKVPLYYYPYVIKPLFAGVFPSKLMYLHHVRRFKLRETNRW